MSHDIRTPMNAIIGYTNLAKKDDVSATTYDYLEKIESSSQHLLGLINDILEMSRIESGRIELELEPADLCRLIDELYDLFVHQMEQKRIAFSVHTEHVRHRYVWCDENYLNRVLLNLVSNAYKFTPEEGAITVSVREDDEVEEGFGAYELRVKDSGRGMSQEFAERMFNAFERERTSTASRVEGTGLGLAITKSIVDQMGGTIEVITSPGEGTEMIVRVRLQLVEGEEVADGEAEPAGEEELKDFTGIRTLLDIVADFERPEQQDDNSACEILQGTLQPHTDGHPRSTENGDEGGHLDAHDPHRGDHKQHLQKDVNQRMQKLLQRRINLMPVVGSLHHPVDQVDQFPVHQQH
jgi:two-component sensor histidine kinase